MKRKPNFRLILFIVFSVFLLACNFPDNSETAKPRDTAASEPTMTPDPTPVPTSESSAEPAVPAETPAVQEETDDIGRPVIELYADRIILNCGDSIGDYAMNVKTAYDPEDGNLEYNFIGGIVVPDEEEAKRTWEHIRHPEDNPGMVHDGKGFYFAMGWNFLDGKPGTLPVVATAYDSEGYVSVKEFEILYLESESSEAIGRLTVNVNLLNVRDIPDVSGNKVGKTWENCSYLYYDVQQDSEYTWYRIGDDMWIADNGSWITK